MLTSTNRVGAVDQIQQTVVVTPALIGGFFALIGGTLGFAFGGFAHIMSGGSGGHDTDDSATLGLAIGAIAGAAVGGAFAANYGAKIANQSQPAVAPSP